MAENLSLPLSSFSTRSSWLTLDTNDKFCLTFSIDVISALLSFIPDDLLYQMKYKKYPKMC